MATVALKSDRLVFSSNEDVEDVSVDHICSLVTDAEEPNVLTLQGRAEGESLARVRLTGLASPVSAADAMSAGYLAWKAPVRCAFTTALSGAIFAAGVITGPTVGGGGTLEDDEETMVLGDRVLVAGEDGGVPNGIYEVTDAGEVGVRPYVLTRTYDFAGTATITGAAVAVRAGTNAGNIYLVDNVTAPTVNTDGIIFTALSAGTVSLTSRSVTLDHMEWGTAGGQLLYYANGEGFAPSRLDMGATGHPLVAGEYEPAYAQLTALGIADNTITGLQLAEGVYKNNLIVGNIVNVDAVGESIRFGDSAADHAAVEIYVHNTLRLSATEVGGAFVGTWSGSSDEKWKDLRGPISTDPLADLDKVESQTWTWKPGYHFGDAGAFGAGVVAQQFQLVCPSAVTFSAEQDGLVVDYNAVHSFNLACIKALKAENASRQAENGALVEANAALAARIEALEARLDSVKALETRLAALEALETRAGSWKALETRLAALEAAYVAPARCGTYPRSAPTDKNVVYALNVGTASRSAIE